jgi:hypothetical protein
MESDSLPPGVTRGPYKGGRRPKVTAWLWIGPALIAVTQARFVVERWTQYRDGWTWVFVACLLFSLVGVAGGVHELRLRRRSTEPGAARQ